MIIYTAIFSAYDRLRSPSVINPAWDYVCICNPQIPVPAPWHTSVRPQVRSPRFSARHYKILSHKTFPDISMTVWHGGNVRLLCDPTDLLDIMGGSDMAVLRHSDRDNVYDEAKVCEQWKKDNPHIIRAQMDRYRTEGFDGKPLSAVFLLVRRHSDAVKEFNEVWYNEVKNGSVRDQLSFDYACWKVGIEPVVIPGDIHRGEYYVRHAVHG